VAPADDAALLTALAIPARGFGAGGVAVKYLKQAAAQRGGVGALLAAAQVRCLCKTAPLHSSPLQPYMKGLSRGATLCAQVVAPPVCTQAVARRGYPPLQGGLKLTRPQQSACSAFLALCAEVEPPAR
jgi:hypothetical protein